MIRTWILVTIVTALSVMPTTAHEVIYRGTVAAVKPNAFAASDGILAMLEVKTSDRGRPVIFDITQHTKLWRGNSSVTFAAARIEKDEPVAVTFSDEDAEKGALEVRLPAAK